MIVVVMIVVVVVSLPGLHGYDSLVDQSRATTTATATATSTNIIHDDSITVHVIIIIKDGDDGSTIRTDVDELDTERGSDGGDDVVTLETPDDDSGRVQANVIVIVTTTIHTIT